MTTKTLTIAFKGDAGDLNSALTAVNSNLGSIGLTATSVKTSLDTVGNNFNAQLVVASENLLKLKIAAATLRESLKEANTSVGNPTISKTVTPQADTLAAIKAEQERRITLTREGLARAELLQREAIAREIAIQQEGANSVTAIKLNQAVKERELYEKQAREVARANEGFVNGTSSWIQAAAQRNAAINSTTAAILRLNERTREQIALANEANAAPQRRIDARTNAAETYRNDTASIIAEQERRLALEQAIRVHGADSLRVIELRSSQEQLAIRQRTATQMAQIERNIANGVISRQRANDLRSTILSQQEAALRANQVHYEGLTQAINANANAHRAANAVVADTTVRSRNLFVHIGEIIGIYRLYTAAIVGVQAALKAVPAAGLERQATEASLLGIFGTEEGIKNLNFVHDIAVEAGQSLLTLEQAYRRYAPSAILAGAKQEEVNKSFRDFAEVGTILHLPEDKINSLFLALDQMYAKGVVQSEEVKKQLGNVLPGAVEVFAQAMGKTPAAFMDAMKANEVIAKDAVPKFAAYYRQIFGGPDDSVFNLIKDRLQSNLNRLETAYSDLNRKIFESSKDAMNKVVKASSDMVNSVTENLTGITQGVILLAEALTLRLAGAAFVGIIANFSLLATKVSALTTLILGIPAIPAAVVASVIYLYGKINDLSAAYDKATGFTIQFEDQQVSLTNYIKAFAIVALDELKTALEAFSSSSVGKFGTEAGEAIKSGFVASIELATDSVYKLIAAYKTFEDSRNTSQKAFNLADTFRKNLEEVRAATSELSDANSIAYQEQQKVIKLAAGLDQEDLLAYINGLSATNVSDAIAAGKLDAINYKAGWEQGIEGIGTSIFKGIKDDLNGTSALQIPLQANQAYGQMFDTITARAEETDAIIRKALAGSLDIPARENAQLETDYSSLVSEESNKRLSEAIAKENNLLKQSIDNINNSATLRKQALENSLKNLEFNQANPNLGNALPIQQYENKRLSLVKEILAIEEKKTSELLRQNLQAKENISNMEKELDLSKANIAEVIRAVRLQESGSRDRTAKSDRAVSSTGAVGAMQIFKAAWIDTGREVENFQKASYEELDQAGQDYFKQQIKRFNDLRAALAAYKEGPTAVANLYAKVNVKVGEVDPKELQKVYDAFTPAMEKYSKEVIAKLPANKVSNELIQKQTEINTVRQQQAENQLQAQQRVTEEQQKQVVNLQSYKNALRELEAASLESQGKVVEAGQIRIDLKYKELELQYKYNEEALKYIAILRQQAEMQNKIAPLQEKLNRLQTEGQNSYNNAINKTNILVQTGVISQLDAAFQLTEANQRRIASMEQELAKAKEIREVMESQGATDQQKYEQESRIVSMTNELENLRLKANEVATFFNTEFGAAFDDAFGSFLSGSQTAKEAFKSFAQSVVDDIGKIIARELRLQAIKGVVSLITSLAGGSSTGLSDGINLSNNSISLGSIGSAAGFANGGVASGLSSISGSILASPTYFPNAKVIPLASGGVVAGEKGHEAVLPLKRNSKGKLGVEVSSSGNMGNSITIQNLSVSVVEKEDVTSEEQAHLIATMIRSQLKTVVQTELADSTRSGRSLNPTQMAATF